MPDRHEPDPRFVESLKWQLGSELRRQNRAGISHRKSIRALKIAGLMVGSVALGAAAMGASQQFGEAWRKELLEARLEVQLELAQQRVQMQLETLGMTREQVEQGLQSDRELLYFEFQIAQAETDAKIMELELEEIRQSGREPLGELSSPLVNGRDFVSERIEARMELARHHLSLVQGEQQRIQDMADAGTVSQNDVQAQRLVALQAEQQLQMLEQQLEVRQAYLNSEITAVEAELKLLELESQSRVALLEEQLQYFQRELDRFQAAMDVGTMQAVAIVQMRTRVAEVEGQLRLARAELDIVRRELERRTAER
jgi:outer membrane protein TolC